MRFVEVLASLATSVTAMACAKEVRTSRECATGIIAHLAHNASFIIVQRVVVAKDELKKDLRIYRAGSGATHDSPLGTVARRMWADGNDTPPSPPSETEPYNEQRGQDPVYEVDPWANSVPRVADSDKCGDEASIDNPFGAFSGLLSCCADPNSGGRFSSLPEAKPSWNEHAAVFSPSEPVTRKEEHFTADGLMWMQLALAPQTSITA